jgi:hypothetical protein
MAERNKHWLQGVETDLYWNWFHKSKHVFDTVEMNDLGSMQRLNERGLIRGYTEYHHPTTNRTPLSDAVRFGRHFGIIQLLLENGANPFATTDKKGILHWSVEHDDIETTRMILENGWRPWTLQINSLNPKTSLMALRVYRINLTLSTNGTDTDKPLYI